MPRNHLQTRLPVALTVPLAAALSAAPVLLHAADIQVTANAVDFVANGNCSIREAIQAANTDTSVDACSAGNGADRILLPASSDFEFTDDSSCLKLPLVNSLITVVGNGSTLRPLSSTTEANGQLFQVRGSAASLRLEDLTLRDAQIQGACETALSGAAVAVYAEARLELAQVTLANNQSPYGGAVSNVDDSTLEAVDSTFTGNSASESGGAFAFAGNAMVTVRDSIFTSNSAGRLAGAIYAGSASSLTLSGSTLSGNMSAAGGGIYANSLAEGTISSSTLSGNVSEQEGGAIAAYSSTLDIFNSTLSGNSAVTGSALYLYSSSVNVINSTLSGNESVTDSSSAHATVVAYEYYSDDTITLTNSVLAGNLPAATANCAIESGTPTFVSNDSVSDVAADVCADAGIMVATTAAIGLGPLANNGGATQTHAIGSESVAVDLVPVGNCVDGQAMARSTDQRGSPAPIDGNGDGTERCDAGAFEYTQLGLSVSNNQTDTVADVRFGEDVVLLDVTATAAATTREMAVISQVGGDLRGQVTAVGAGLDLGLRLLVDVNGNGMADSADMDITNTGVLNLNQAGQRFSFTFNSGQEQTLAAGASQRYLLAANISSSTTALRSTWQWSQSAWAGDNSASWLVRSLAPFGLLALLGLWLAAGLLPAGWKQRSRQALGLAMATTALTACSGGSPSNSAGIAAPFTGDLQLTLDAVTAQSSDTATNLMVSGLEVVGTEFTVAE